MNGSSRLLVAVTLLIVTPFLLAADKPADVVKYRQSVMRGYTASMSALSAIAKGKASFPAHAAAHAAALRATAPLTADLFPAGTGSDVTKTEALPAIWSEAPAYRAATQQFVTAVARLEQAAQRKDRAALAAELQAVSQSCASCHERFRLKDED